MSKKKHRRTPVALADKQLAQEPGNIRIKKKPKNLQFSDEVLNWFEREERRTGASHSRIALAAIMAYMSSEYQYHWIRLAVLADKGEISLDQVPWSNTESIMAQAIVMIEISKGTKPDNLKAVLGDVEKLLKTAKIVFPLPDRADYFPVLDRSV